MESVSSKYLENVKSVQEVKAYKYNVNAPIMSHYFFKFKK